MPTRLAFGAISLTRPRASSTGASAWMPVRLAGLSVGDLATGAALYGSLTQSKTTAGLSLPWVALAAASSAGVESATITSTFASTNFCAIVVRVGMSPWAFWRSNLTPLPSAKPLSASALTTPFAQASRAGWEVSWKIPTDQTLSDAAVEAWPAGLVAAAALAGLAAGDAAAAALAGVATAPLAGVLAAAGVAPVAPAGLVAAEPAAAAVGAATEVAAETGAEVAA